MTEDFRTVDLSDFAPDPFLEKLQRIKRLYEDMGTAFGFEEEMVDQERRRSEEKAPISYEEWEHQIYDDQQEDLHACHALRAQFVLVFLATAIGELLSDAQAGLERRTGESARRVRQSGDAKPEKSRRTNWIEKQFQQFFSKFQIDFAKYSGWEDVKEVVMARDAVVHPKSMREYRESRPVPTYIDGDEISLTTPEFSNAIKRLEGFCQWLRAEVKARCQAPEA